MSQVVSKLPKHLLTNRYNQPLSRIMCLQSSRHNSQIRLLDRHRPNQPLNNPHNLFLNSPSNLNRLNLLLNNPRHSLLLLDRTSLLLNNPPHRLHNLFLSRLKLLLSKHSPIRNRLLKQTANRVSMWLR